jgi:hypothetical protein
MTHESIYPELKTMKSSEVFIEWVTIMNKKGKILKKMKVLQIISKKELTVFLGDLREKYSGDEISFSAISK